MTEKEMQDQVADAQAKADKFQRLHADGEIEHALRKAAEEGKAFNPDQIITLLKGNARLVEADGKHVVHVVTVGDDGQEIHHSPAQAVWHLRQNKDNFNFFRDLEPIPKRGQAPRGRSSSRRKPLLARSQSPFWDRL